VPPKESATILVVEENPAVLELIDQVMRECGHRVLSTNDAVEAIDVASRVRIDVVIAGALRDGGKHALVCQLRSIQPDVDVVFCDPDDDDDETIDRATRLSAPFSLSELREAVVSPIRPRRSQKSG
jgi:CheY-like chemotaxis protein